MIDPHVHLRDWNQADKETLEHGFTVAWAAGISAVFEMPNTDPPLTDRASIERRIDHADRTLERLGIPLFHGLYAGISREPEQIREVVTARKELFPRVVGLKLYAGHSTGRMGVTTIEEQHTVWKTLARCDYRGVVAVHAESEAILRPDLRDVERPETHGPSRPSLSELASTQTLLVLAEASGFRGHLHFCHVSISDAVELIRAQRDALPFSVTMGVTPHHVLLNEAAAAQSALLSVNPPVRDEQNRALMMEHLVRGDVDWIETDHAPHTIDDKMNGASGLPGFPGFVLLNDYLARRGIDREVFTNAASESICRAFGMDSSTLTANDTPSSYRELSREYPWDPYSGLDISRIS